MYKTVKTQTNLPVKICHLKVIILHMLPVKHGFSCYIITMATFTKLCINDRVIITRMLVTLTT